jgi:hypothetical protein
LSDKDTDSVEAIRCKLKLFQCTKQESSEYSLLIVPYPIQVMGIYWSSSSSPLYGLHKDAISNFKVILPNGTII